MTLLGLQVGSWAECAGTIATFLAVVISLWQSHKASKSAEKNREDTYKQIEINKQNNFQVQAKSFKLQFCLQELEKKEILYETSVSDINVVMESIQHENPVDIKESSKQLNGNLHELMHNAGSLQTIIRAANPEKEGLFLCLIENIKKSSTEIEKMMNGLSQNKLIKKNEISKIDIGKIHKYFDDMVEMRNFIIDQMDRVFKKMN
ncbi:hypothetical protein [Liquorilactobacillus nagelii]|uniref:hypothetical protein n=1 Tax=Liquorilactobacillus nagelii TaxID=82688 RepID=UPI0039E9D6B9